MSGQTVSFRGTGFGNFAIVRLDAVGTGVWITSVSSPDGATANSLAVDPVSKEVYVGGDYSGNGAQLGTGASALFLTEELYYTGWFAKISAAGVPMFFKALTVGPNPADPTADREVVVYGIAFDTASSSVWVVGYYTPGDFVFAGQTLNPYNKLDSSVVLMRYGTDGSELFATNYISEGPNYDGTR